MFFINFVSFFSWERKKNPFVVQFDDDGAAHALPVGDAALADELARVAANGERISCDEIIDWVCKPFKSIVSLLLLPPTSRLLLLFNDDVDIGGPSLLP